MVALRHKGIANFTKKQTNKCQKPSVISTAWSLIITDCNIQLPEAFCHLHWLVPLHHRLYHSSARSLLPTPLTVPSSSWIVLWLKCQKPSANPIDWSLIITDCTIQVPEAYCHAHWLAPHHHARSAFSYQHHKTPEAQLHYMVLYDYVRSTFIWWFGTASERSRQTWQFSRAPYQAMWKATGSTDTCQPLLHTCERLGCHKTTNTGLQLKATNTCSTFKPQTRPQCLLTACSFAFSPTSVRPLIEKGNLSTYWQLAFFF